MTHNEASELLPAYALRALTPEESRAVESHVRGCRDCQRDLAAFTTVTAAMADSVVMTTPPPALRARVMEAVRTEPRVAPRPTVRVLPQRAPAPQPRLWSVALAVAAAAAFILIGAFGLLFAQRLADLNAEIVQTREQVRVLTTRLAQQEQLLAIVTNPSLKRATLAGSVVGDVQFVYDASARQGALIVRNLGDPGQGLVYQLWLVAPIGAPQSAGVFRPASGGSLVVPVAADFARYKAVAISVEQGPNGAPQPTRVPILSATL